MTGKANKLDTTPNPYPSERISGSERRVRTDGDWDLMEQELEGWAKKLDELRSKSHLIGRDTLNDLEARYKEVKRQADALREEVENLDEGDRDFLRNSQDFVADKSAQAKESLDDLSAKAKVQTETATKKVKEASDKLKVGMSEMSEGVKRAWDELIKAFDAASEKMQDKKSGHGD